MNHDHVFIEVIDTDLNGGEYVPALQISNGDWELIRSPLYATEVASGDIIRVTNAEKGKFEMLKRGGNVCIQYYLGEDEADDAVVTADLANQIGVLVKPLGGRIDAITEGLISITIPLTVGFQAIEAVFEVAIEKSIGAQWQLANVYDPISGESLDWWNE